MKSLCRRTIWCCTEMRKYIESLLITLRTYNNCKPKINAYKWPENISHSDRTSEFKYVCSVSRDSHHGNEFLSSPLYSDRRAGAQPESCPRSIKVTTHPHILLKLILGSIPELCSTSSYLNFTSFFLSSFQKCLQSFGCSCLSLLTVRSHLVNSIN
jgi:hypothetical protein